MGQIRDMIDILKSKFSCPPDQMKKVYADLQKLNLDRAIGMNMVFCFGAFGLLLLLYFALQWLWKHIYQCRSLYNSDKIPCYSLWSIFFSFGMADEQLVNHIGLDCYMFLQTNRLCFSLIFFMFLMTFFCLVVPLMIFRFDKEQIFLSLSILNVQNSEWVWVLVALLQWIFVIYAMNALETFWKWFVELRQEYLEKPTCLMSVDFVDSIKVCQARFCSVSSEEVSNAEGTTSLAASEKAYEEIFDVASCSVIAKRLPKSVTNNEELMEYVSGLKLGNVKCVTLVEDCLEYLNLLVQKREVAVVALENAYSSLLAKVSRKIEESLRGTNTLETNASQNIHSWCSSFYSFSQMTSEEKQALITRINDDFSPPMLQCRPKSISFWRIGKRQDVITRCLKEIDEIDRQLMQLKLEYSEREQQAVVPLEMENVEEESPKRVKLFSIGPMVLFPFSTLLQPFLQHLKARKSAIITFSEAKEAFLAKQCLLEEEVINTKFVAAPTPADIVWTNLQQFSSGSISKSFYKMAYYFIILLWSIPIAIVAFLTETAFVRLVLEDWFGLNTRGNKYFVSIWEGLIAPGALSVLIAIVPILLNVIATKEGYVSRSSIAYHSANMYNWFLFFQPFLFTLLSSSFFRFFESITQADYCHLMFDFQQTLLKKSSFFFNFIIQRMTLDMGMLLIRLPDLIFKWILFSRKGSPRKAANDLAPVAFPFAHTFPKVVAVFSVTIIYGTISPVILAVGSFYYLISYVVHCYSFLNVFSHTAESGGLYWNSNFFILLYSIALSCLATLIQLLLSKSFFAALLILPSLFFVLMRGKKIQEKYQPYLRFQPLKKRKDPSSDSLVPQATTEREKMQQIYTTQTVPSLEEHTAKAFVVGESIRHCQKLNQREIWSENWLRWLMLPNYYSCPISFSSEVEVYYPDGFFEIFKYWYEIYLASIPTSPTATVETPEAAV